MPDSVEQIIKETVREVLEARKKGIIFEMPVPRNVYKERIDSEFPQVLINWSLVRYRTITNNEPYKKHWKGKTRGHMYALANLVLKGGDNISKRKKVFNEIVYENDYDNPKHIALTICNKFIEEQIDINSQEFYHVVNDCLKAIPEIISLILGRDINAINQYVETI